MTKSQRNWMEVHVNCRTETLNFNVYILEKSLIQAKKIIMVHIFKAAWEKFGEKNHLCPCSVSILSAKNSEFDNYIFKLINKMLMFLAQNSCHNSKLSLEIAFWRTLKSIIAPATTNKCQIAWAKGM